MIRTNNTQSRESVFQAHVKSVLEQQGIEAKKQNIEGRPGELDLRCNHRNVYFFIEIKGRGGRLSLAQILRMKELKKQGTLCWCCISPDSEEKENRDFGIVTLEHLLEEIREKICGI